MKTAKTFRLSIQAVERLQILKEKTGTNETAIIEIALALFERSIIQAIENQSPKEIQAPSPNRKKRKRHK